MIIYSTIALGWQLFVLFLCCSGLGLALLRLIPKEFSLLHKMLFSLLGGVFLVVLIPQNFVYLGFPIRISAWLLLGSALVQIWWYRRRLWARILIFYADGDFRALATVLVLTVAFHSIVPIRQGLDWYFGKGYEDQLNYVLLAEFLKEEPYSTSEQEVGLRPWLVRPVGFQTGAKHLGMPPEPAGQEIGQKKEGLGQSVITAEISAWSGLDGKGGYAATVIFFLTLLIICLYVSLRGTGIDRFMAGSGALVAALLPVVTRLSLNGSLSQISILFVFPFFAILLRKQELSARSFTLFFSLTLAYVVSAYAEIAPLGFCTLFLGVLFIRRDAFRTRRLTAMSVPLLVALANPYYLRNLIQFLSRQYTIAGTTFLDHLAPNIRTLSGWSELFFGVTTSAPSALFSDFGVLLLGSLALAGIFFLSKRDRLILGAVLLPSILAISCLTVLTAHSYYPVAKITITMLPFAIGLFFVFLSKVAANRPDRSLEVLKKLVCACVLAGAAAGSARYYSEVLNNEGLLAYLREPRFLNVCRELEKINNKRLLVFETNPWLTRWLCYHARQNEIYFDRRFIIDASVSPLAPFLQVPDLAHVDFVVTRERIVNLRAPGVSYLNLVDDLPGEHRTAGHDSYWLGPPAGLRFLAFQPLSANLKMRFMPGPDATTLPVDFLLADDQGHVSQAEIRDETLDFRRIDFPRGPSYMQLSIKAKENDPNARPSAWPILAVLDEVHLSDIELHPKK